MERKLFQKQLLLQNVQMDSNVSYMINGDIYIYPCPWEHEKQVTDGKRIRYEGGIEVDADGRTRVKRWNRGSKGPLHDTLYETIHGAVKITRPLYDTTLRGARRRLDKESVYVTFKFPKKYDLELIKAFFKEETEQVMDYLNTRKEETIWE